MQPAAPVWIGVCAEPFVHEPDRAGLDDAEGGAPARLASRTVTGSENATETLRFAAVNRWSAGSGANRRDVEVGSRLRAYIPSAPVRYALGRIVGVQSSRLNSPSITCP